MLLFLTVDVVLLTLKQDQLYVGLVQRLNKDEPFYGVWTLPGGFVRPQEDNEARDTAIRVLRTKAGVESPYLEQLATFSGNARDPRGWSASITYYALVNEQISANSQERLRWEPVDEVLAAPMPFDHKELLMAAVARLRSKTSYSSLPLHLMPSSFTLSELRRVYEVVLGGKLEPRGFARRVMEQDFVEEVGIDKGEAHRPARLFRAKKSAPLYIEGTFCVL